MFSLQESHTPPFISTFTINLISENPYDLQFDLRKLPVYQRVLEFHFLMIFFHKPGSVSSLEDYPVRWDSSLLGSSSEFDRTSENSSLLTSPRISFSHDPCHENKSVPSVEDYQSDSLLLGFGSDIDLISENPSFPTSPRISFSHDLCHEGKSIPSIEDYQSDSLLHAFGSEIDLISENPSFPRSPRILFSDDLFHEDRSVPSVEDYQSDSLLLGFGSDIDLVSETSIFASSRSSNSRNICSVSSLDNYSCSSDFDFISETVGFSASPRSWVSRCICCADSLSLASDSSFDFCISNDTAKQHSSSENELFLGCRIQAEKPLASSELIPLSGAVESERQKNQSESLRHVWRSSCQNSPNKRSLLRSYSTGSLLGCKRLAEFN